MPTPIQRNRARGWVHEGGNNSATSSNENIDMNNNAHVPENGANINDPSAAAFYGHPSLYHNPHAHNPPPPHPHNAHHSAPIPHHNPHHHNPHHNINAVAAAAHQQSLFYAQQRQQQQQLEQLELRRRIILMEAEHHQQQQHHAQAQVAQQQQQHQYRDQHQLERLEMVHAMQQQQQQQLPGVFNNNRMDMIGKSSVSRSTPPTIEIQSDEDEETADQNISHIKQLKEQQEPNEEVQEKDRGHERERRMREEIKHEQQHQSMRMDSETSLAVKAKTEKDQVDQNEDERSNTEEPEMIAGNKPEAHAYWQKQKMEQANKSDTDNEADDEEGDEEDDEEDDDEDDDDDEDEDDDDDEDEDDDDDEEEEEEEEEEDDNDSQKSEKKHSTVSELAESKNNALMPNERSRSRLHGKKDKHSNFKAKAKKLPIKSPSSFQPHSDTASETGTEYGTTKTPKMEISDEEYIQLKILLEQFCKVPLLAEYSRPVSYLHPELNTLYSSIVKHPMDLSHVCRKVHKRQYYTIKQVKIDMWRIFSNCVKFHSDTTARENAIPSFISIALHLREFFNALWQEYMLPSDLQSSTTQEDADIMAKDGTMSSWKILFERRDCARQIWLAAVGTTPLSQGCLHKASDAIQKFLQNNGKVDIMDSKELFGSEEGADDDGSPYERERKALEELQKSLLKKLHTNQEYTVDDFALELRNCVEQDRISSDPLLNRLNRIIGKIVVPIYEMSCRGVNQSSIWGCMAAAIWARESSKKKYWPALVLGILAPVDQREEWHKSLTERNEARLPSKLAQELKGGKKRAENNLTKASDPSSNVEQMSYFLVEFMGKHEFSWVREADILENFDPSADPNVEKKKSKNGPGSNARLFATAVNEGKWAVEEFELQLQNPCGDFSDEDDDGYTDDFVNFSTLCESDGEGDDRASRREEMITTTDEEEAEELFSSEGLLDLSLSGRKKAKKRLSHKKKLKENEQKKARAEQLKLERARAAKKKQEMKQKRKSLQEAASKARAKAKKEASEQKKLEKEREKEERKEQRERERIKRKQEKELKEEEQRLKKRRTSSGSSSKQRKSKEKSPQRDDAKSPKRGGRSKSSGIPHKRARAEAVVKHFISRIAHEEEKKGLPITGAVNTPSSGIASYGLLGMSLAFRAAAGTVNFPEKLKTERVLRPWEKVDTESAPSSSERCKQLKKQIELLETDIKKLLEYEERKKILIEIAEDKKRANYKKIKANDREARAVCERYAKTRKKSTGGGSTPGKSNGKSKKGGRFQTKSSGQKSRKSKSPSPKRDKIETEKSDSEDDKDDVEQKQAKYSRTEGDDNDESGMSEEGDVERVNEDAEGGGANDQFDDPDENSE